MLVTATGTYFEIGAFARIPYKRVCDTSGEIFTLPPEKADALSEACPPCSSTRARLET